MIEEQEKCGAEREGNWREWVGVLFEETGGNEPTESERGE